MDIRLLLARRYLVSRRRVSLISIIAGLSVAGVAVGVASLIVVLSVMNGFFAFARDLMVSLDPHVRIVAVGGIPEDSARAVRQLAASLDGVASVAPYVEGKALLVGAPNVEVNKVVVVRGVEPGAFVGSRPLDGATVQGTFDLGRTDAGGAGIVLGGGMASRLGLVPFTPSVDGMAGYPGSPVTLVSAQAVEASIANPFGMPPGQRYELRGTFEMEAAYDQSHAFVALPEAQRLFRMDARVSGLELRLDDLNNAEAVKATLRERLAAQGLAGRYDVLTWYDLHAALYGVMRLEKWGASIILLLIVVVAAFNIVGSLTMIVIEKRRDVGVLAAMGLSRQKIRQVFLLEGLLVGLVGTGLGLALGLGLAVFQKATGFVKLSSGDAFLIAAYPVEIRALDVAMIVLAALGLCVLAAVYPARRAARQEPALAVSQP